MEPKSAKNKGRRFENFVNHEIEQMGFGKAIRTPGSGSGKVKGDSFNNLDFLLECKNEKVIKWNKNIGQAKRQAEQGNYDPDKWALVVRDPKTPEANPEVYTVIDFWQFLELCKRAKEPIIKQPDRETKYIIQNTIIWLKKLEKQLKE